MSLLDSRKKLSLVFARRLQTDAQVLREITQTVTTSSLYRDLQNSVSYCVDGVMNRLRHVVHIVSSDPADVDSSTVQEVDVVFLS